MKNYSLKEAQNYLGFDPSPHLSLFKSVLDHVIVNEFENKDHIVQAEVPISRLYLLVEGKAKISMLHEDGHSSIVYFVKPNEMIGELTLIGIEDRPKDVISIGTCICLSVPMEVAESSLLNDKDFMLLMSRFIGTKLLDRTWFNAKQQHYELKHRLAAYILKCECDGLFNEKHTETAEYLAVSYRHLLHTIQSFKEDNILTKNKKGYTFDRYALEELASVLE